MYGVSCSAACLCTLCLPCATGCGFSCHSPSWTVHYTVHRAALCCGGSVHAERSDYDPAWRSRPLPLRVKDIQRHAEAHTAQAELAREQLQAKRDHLPQKRNLALSRTGYRCSRRQTAWGSRANLLGRRLGLTARGTGSRLGGTRPHGVSLNPLLACLWGFGRLLWPLTAPLVLCFWGACGSLFVDGSPALVPVSHSCWGSAASCSPLSLHLATPAGLYVPTCISDGTCWICAQPFSFGTHSLPRNLEASVSRPRDCFPFSTWAEVGLPVTWPPNTFGRALSTFEADLPLCRQPRPAFSLSDAACNCHPVPCQAESLVQLQLSDDRAGASVWDYEVLIRSFLLLQLLDFFDFVPGLSRSSAGAAASIDVFGAPAPFVLVLLFVFAWLSASPLHMPHPRGAQHMMRCPALVSVPVILFVFSVPLRDRTPRRRSGDSCAATEVPPPGWDAATAPSSSPLFQPFDKHLALQLLRLQARDRFCPIPLAGLRGEADLVDEAEEAFEVCDDGTQLFAVQPQPATDLVALVAAHKASLRFGRSPICFQLHLPLITLYWADILDHDVGVDDVQEAFRDDWIVGASVYVADDRRRLSHGERRSVFPGCLIRVVHPRLTAATPLPLEDKLGRHERLLRDAAVRGFPEPERAGLVYGLLQLLLPPQRVNFSPGPTFTCPCRLNEVVLSHASRDWQPHFPVWPQPPVRDFRFRGEPVFQAVGAFPSTLCGRAPVIIDGRLADLPLRLYASKVGVMSFEVFLHWSCGATGDVPRY